MFVGELWGAETHGCRVDERKDERLSAAEAWFLLASPLWGHRVLTWSS